MCCCCRCDEVQCQTGIVVANYTAALQDIPLPLGEAEPPYTFSTTNSQDAVEDDGRQFPGNVAEGEELLFVQCWNTTAVSSQVSCK